MGAKKIIHDAIFILYFLKDILREKINGAKGTKPSKLGNDIVVLGNGPSQKKFWTNREVFSDYDILCMNEFIVYDEEKFFDIRPKYYCCIDRAMMCEDVAKKVNYPVFLKRNEILEKVDWSLVFITRSHYELPIKNEKITKIGISDRRIDLYNKTIRFELYRKNLGCIPAETVAATALFFSILFGYKNIALFGVDHDDIKEIAIGEDNKVSLSVPHSYDRGKPDKVYIRDELDKKHYIYELFEGYTTVFKSYLEIQQFACAQNANVINYNIKSLVDAFKKADLEE